MLFALTRCTRIRSFSTTPIDWHNQMVKERSGIASP